MCEIYIEQVLKRKTEHGAMYSRSPVYVLLKHRQKA